MPFVTANGIRIHYERVGLGDRLLLISGTGADLRKPPFFSQTRLAKAFDTILYDQRGLGRTDKPGPCSMADYAEDAARLMDAIGWPDAMVVGISFGGMVAQELAIRGPDRVSRLVLCCTSAGGAGGASYPLHEIRHLDAEARARHQLGVQDIRRDKHWVTAHHEEAEAIVRAAASDPFAAEPGHADGAREQILTRARHDCWDRLHLIECPTLICAGRYDGVSPPANQENLRSRIPMASLRFYEGGHTFYWQDERAFTDIIAFLNGAGYDRRG